MAQGAHNRLRRENEPTSATPQRRPRRRRHPPPSQPPTAKRRREYAEVQVIRLEINAGGFFGPRHEIFLWVTIP